MTDKDKEAAKKAWDLKVAKDFEAKKAWVKTKSAAEQKEIFAHNPELAKACKADFKEEDAKKVKALKAKEAKKISVNVEDGEVLHVKMGTDERFIIDVCFTDDYGNEAAVKDVPYWEVSDGEVLYLIPSECGCHCDVRPAGKVGSATVTVYAEGADGEIYQDVDVEVVIGFATEVHATITTPEVF